MNDIEKKFLTYFPELNIEVFESFLLEEFTRSEIVPLGSPTIFYDILGAVVVGVHPQKAGVAVSFDATLHPGIAAAGYARIARCFSKELITIIADHIFFQNERTLSNILFGEEATNVATTRHWSMLSDHNDALNLAQGEVIQVDKSQIN